MNLVATPRNPVAGFSWESLRVRELEESLRATRQATICALNQMLDLKDLNTGVHSTRLAEWAVRVGRELGLDERGLEDIETAALLHDAGKVGVPDAILMKPGRLTPDEFEIMKRHTVIGDALCGDLRLLRPVSPIARHHHERCDGSGYPDGLTGNDIPLLAQITGIVDVYDALTSDRPYRKALTQDAAVKELLEEARRGWRRADLVEEFVAICTDGRLKRLAPASVAPRSSRVVPV